MRKIKYCLSLISFTLLFLSHINYAYAHREGIDKCLTVGFWVEDSMYDFFDPSKNQESRNTFEQWADRQMAAWTDMAAKSGVKDCFTIAKIVRVQDDELPLSLEWGRWPQGLPNGQDKDVDSQWGFTKKESDRWQETESADHITQKINGIDYGLLHELSHQRYLVDISALNIHINRDKIEVTDPNGITIIGNYFKPLEFDVIYYSKCTDLMDQSSYSYYCAHSAEALNRIAGKHIPQVDRKYGIFLEDLPRNNVLRILDRDGIPISAAKVRIFQSVALNPGEEQYAKKIDNIADIRGFTDFNGEIFIGHNPFGEDKGRKNNKDRKISPALTNGLFILEVSIDNQLDYKIIEVTDFNLAYWAGATERAVYDIKTNLTIPPTPTPTPAPDFITRLNCQNECSTKKEGQDLDNCLTNCYAKYRKTPTPASTPTPSPSPTITVPIQAQTPTPSQTDTFTIKFHYLDSNGNPLRDIYLNDQVVTVTVKNLSTNKIIIEKSNPGDLTFPLPKVGSDKIRITANPISGYEISSSTCHQSIKCDPIDRRYFDLNTVDFPVSFFMPEELKHIEAYFKYTPTSLVSPTTEPTYTVPTLAQDQVSTPTPTLSLETPTPTPTSLEPTPTLPPTVTLPTSTPTSSPEPPTSTPTPIEKKRITGITINGTDIDINNPTTAINLPVTQGQEGTFVVPVIVTYSDGTTKKFDLIFHYKPPPTPTPTVEPTPVVVSPTPIYTPTPATKPTPTPTPRPTKTPTSTPTPFPTSCSNISSYSECVKKTGCTWIEENEPPFLGYCIFSSIPTPTPTPLVPPKICTYYYDCVDGNPCTTDSCNQGKCSYSQSQVGTVCERSRDYPYDPIKQCDIFGACIKL